MYKRQALSSVTINEMVDCLDLVKAHEESRVLTLKGAGDKAFVAGADISEMSSKGEKELLDYVELGHSLMDKIESFATPVVALVDGFALGGGFELALACDLIFASEKSKLGFPEVGLGLIPGFGGTQRVLSRVSVGMAKKLVYSGSHISAAEAYRVGLVDLSLIHI